MLTVNTTDYEIARAREVLAYGSIDAKRPTAWTQYGYPDSIPFEKLRQAYERGGAGFGAVHRLLEKCWQHTPRIKQPEADDETPWERKATAIVARFWDRLIDLDRRNLVGQFAAIIYRAADGLALDQPMQKAKGIADLVPVWQDQIRVEQWDTDPASPTFGLPLMWGYRARRPGADVDNMAQPDKWARVHPSRVQVLAEGASGSDFLEGVPLLRAGFNSLIDIEKISGGSAEGYLKNSGRQLHFKFAPDAAPQVITQNPDGSTSAASVRDVVETQARALNRSIDASVVTQGADVNTLQTTMHDPTGAFQLAANLFAASVQIPFTVLFGQQTGRLASDQDTKDMAARCASRQQRVLTPMLVQLVTRLQAAGVIEAGEFEIEWEPTDAPGEKDKAELLGKYTAAMKQAFDAGLTEPLFDGNELRRVVGFEERSDDGLPTEGDPAQDPPPADPAAPAP